MFFFIQSSQEVRKCIFDGRIIEQRPNGRGGKRCGNWRRKLQRFRQRASECRDSEMELFDVLEEHPSSQLGCSGRDA